MTKAGFFLGTQVYDTDVPLVDANLTDKELFETVLHEMAVKWSSTGGTPNHKAAMAKNGCVIRCNGKVHISGSGWFVTYTTPEFDATESRLIANKDWEGLVDFINEDYTKVTFD